MTEKQALDESLYTWDFGKVQQGDIAKHNFTFKNETTATLHIKDINTSCGCTVSQVKKKTLLSGEETLIEVRFNSKGYSGGVKQFIYVHTDNLDKPLTRYIIKAEVVK